MENFQKIAVSWSHSFFIYQNTSIYISSLFIYIDYLCFSVILLNLYNLYYCKFNYKWIGKFGDSLKIKAKQVVAIKSGSGLAILS